MTNATDALRALAEKCVAAVDTDFDAMANTLCEVADALLLLATPAGSASGEVPFAVVGGVEFDSPQALCAAHADLQAEVAQLRELATLIVDGAMPATTSGATCFVPRYQIDKLRAAMGSANGQG